MQNNRPKTIAQWIIPIEEFIKRFNDLGHLDGFSNVNVVLTEENKYTFVYTYSEVNFVESQSKLTYNTNYSADRKDSLAIAILNNELGPPTFGTYQSAPIQEGCTCNSWNLFNHGCPSARGERCRSQ